MNRELFMALRYLDQKLNGKILRVKINKDGYYLIDAKINGNNPSFRVKDGYLDKFVHKSGHWNWERVGKLQQAVKRESRLEEMKKAIE